MPEFKFRVIETRTQEVEYAVEAETEEEARQKAEIGDTTMEVELEPLGEVIDREIVG